MKKTSKKSSTEIRFTGFLDEASSRKLRLVAAYSDESVSALTSRVIKSYVDRKFAELMAELKELTED